MNKKVDDLIKALMKRLDRDQITLVQLVNASVSLHTKPKGIANLSSQQCFLRSTFLNKINQLYQGSDLIADEIFKAVESLIQATNAKSQTNIQTSSKSHRNTRIPVRFQW